MNYSIAMLQYTYMLFVLRIFIMEHQRHNHTPKVTDKLQEFKMTWVAEKTKQVSLVSLRQPIGSEDSELSDE